MKNGFEMDYLKIQFSVSGRMADNKTNGGMTSA